jgi:hypothetical protein
MKLNLGLTGGVLLARPWSDTQSCANARISSGPGDVGAERAGDKCEQQKGPASLPGLLLANWILPIGR